MLNTIKKLVIAGWKAITEAHTAYWVYGGFVYLGVLPAISAIPAIQGWDTAEFPYLVALGIFIWAVLFLCVLAYEGRKHLEKGGVLNMPGDESRRHNKATQIPGDEPMPFLAPGMDRMPEYPEWKASDTEFVALAAAMKLAYEQLRESHSIYARAAEKMSRPSKGESRADAILQWLACLVVPKLDLYGESPPSTRRERINPRIVKSGVFTAGLSQLNDKYGTSGPLFSNLEVRKIDLDKVVASLSAATKLEEFDSTPEADFEAGFQRAEFKRHPTRENAVLRLTQLRSTGVVIRNRATQVREPNELHEWIRKVQEWMDEVIDALRAVSDADAEWFKTLDVVPPARINVPIRLSLRIEAERFQATFNQHDYRLVRLERLLFKYGVAYVDPKQ